MTTPRNSTFRLRFVQGWVDPEGRVHHYFRRAGPGILASLGEKLGEASRLEWPAKPCRQERKLIAYVDMKANCQGSPRLPGWPKFTPYTCDTPGVPFGRARLMGAERTLRLWAGAPRIYSAETT